MMIHSQNDDVVPFQPSKDLSEEIGAQFISFKKSGHISASIICNWFVWRKVKRFILK